MQRNQELKSHTTFGVSALANYFAAIKNIEDFKKIYAPKEIRELPLLILGGGSNILFTKNFDGVVIKNEIRGIEVIKENEEQVWVQVGAGENWHEFVLTAIEKGWAGVENLSLIPGCVGAAPMQNIGAYGMEINQVLEEVEAFHLPTGELHTLSNADCNLGYRESVFKNEYKNQYLITKVVFRLNKTPNFNISYGAIKEQLDAMNISELSLRAVSDAVILIRQSKLPDPKEIGNAGSFFKNPVVSIEEAHLLKSQFENMPQYPAPNEQIKLAAGWLIEQSGWKGKTFGNYGIHKKQALVLVNYGGATGEDIYQLSGEIIADVKEKFGVELVREVNVV